ncbi:universal stress protein [Glaciimonas sp. GG7]
MFKHILLPTDGSAASNSAIQKCIAFAKSSGAAVTGMHVIPAFHIFTYQVEMLEDTREQFKKQCIVEVNEYLARIDIAAKRAGVQCDTFYVSSDHPYEEIIKAAKDKHCDLIAMASHGKKGMKGLLMGSETQKVLMHSQIPVLVYR